jgi:hypothetical protein
MDPLDDFDVDQKPAEVRIDRTDSAKRGQQLAIVGMVVGLAAIAALVIWLLPSRKANQPTAGTKAQPVAGTERGPLGPGAAPIDVPPLEMTDALVRQLISALSSKPEIAAWLAGDGLIRNFVASLENVAYGPSPARHVRRLAPQQPFRVVSRGGTMLMDPRSYERYDGLANAAASIDAPGLARAYSTLRPRLEEAYREQGHPDGNVDGAVELAIQKLLAVPVVEGDIRLTAKGGTSYEFEDNRLESLTPAQKQLLRMGPRNVRLVQGKLLEIAHALGIPSSRLP